MEVYIMYSGHGHAHVICILNDIRHGHAHVICILNDIRQASWYSQVPKSPRDAFSSLLPSLPFLRPEASTLVASTSSNCSSKTCMALSIPARHLRWAAWHGAILQTKKGNQIFIKTNQWFLKLIAYSSLFLWTFDECVRRLDAWETESPTF